MKPGTRSGEPYTVCKLFYDGAHPLQPGEFLRTPAGSAYKVTATRLNRNRPYRQMLTCLRWPLEEIPKRAKVHPLHWYARKKKAGRALASLR